jgi:hypothetical protein
MTLISFRKIKEIEKIYYYFEESFLGRGETT